MAQEVRASHILVDNEEYAQQIKRELEKEADFAALATEKSEGPSAADGGDLGFFGRGETRRTVGSLDRRKSSISGVVKPFERAAFDLDVGEVSDPVQTQFGWHLIKKTGER